MHVQYQVLAPNTFETDTTLFTIATHSSVGPTGISSIMYLVQGSTSQCTVCCIQFDKAAIHSFKSTCELNFRQVIVQKDIEYGKFSKENNNTVVHTMISKWPSSTYDFTSYLLLPSILSFFWSYTNQLLSIYRITRRRTRRIRNDTV